MSFTLLTFVLAALLTIAMPGPTSLLAFSNGARHGLRDAGFGIAGAVLSDLVLIAAVSAGLGVLLSTSQLLFSAVKWLGVDRLKASSQQSCPRRNGDHRPCHGKTPSLLAQLPCRRDQSQGLPVLHRAAPPVH